jgi:hypothetical protein
MDAKFGVLQGGLGEWPTVLQTLYYLQSRLPGTHHLMSDPFGIDILVPTREIANKYFLSDM